MKDINKTQLAGGLQKMIICLIGLFSGPFLIHLSLAHDKGISFLIMILGVLISIFAAYVGFKGICQILDSL